MDTDQAILESALGSSRLQDSDLTPQSSPGLDSTKDARAADQSMGQPSMNGDFKQGQLGVTGPSGANEEEQRQESGHEEAVAQLGFAVQFIVQGLRNGGGPTLMPLLVKLLPFLLKTQVNILPICCAYTCNFEPLES